MIKKKEEPETPEDALELALQTIVKTYGKGTIIVGNVGAVPGVEFFSSGCISLDKALGGGWAKGRIIEVIGQESSGKTSVCLHAIAEVQKAGGKAAFIDIEHAFDPEYATNIGVDIEKLIFSQPDSGEQALNVADMLIRTGAISLLVIDSVAALVPEKELEGQVGDSVMGLQARMMSQAMRKLCGIAHNTNTTVMFTNQIRMKFVLFGSPDTTSGGNALKFYASQRVDMRRIGGEKEGDVLVANKTKAKIIKNKVAPPFRETEFLIRYGVGIDKYRDIIDSGIAANIITRGGGTYTLFDKKYKGMSLLTETLHNNADIYSQLIEAINEQK